MASNNDLKGIAAGFAALYVLLAAGCGNPTTGEFRPHPCPVPDIPAMIGSESEAVSYLAAHFWDDFTDTSEIFVCDSSIVNGVRKGEVEQAFANWTGYLHAVPLAEARGAVERMFGRIVSFEERDTSANVFETVASLAEKYLYDPNSPLRSEDLYLPFASRMAECMLVSPGKRAAYEYDAGMCSLNRTGTPAADFAFCDRNGRRYTLYGLESDYTLLFFSNPGCEACKYIIDELKSDPELSSLIASGKVAVANIYIDEDLEAWYGYQSIYPEEWYNGYDPNFIIRTDLLYNVRAIPSLYLLDRDKTVLLKDAPEERIFAELHKID